MIFARLFRWLFQRRRDRERAIFRFWDGRRERAVDPIVAFRLLESDEHFSFERHPPLLEIGDSEATAITVAAVHRAFGVKSFADGGLLESECLDLFLAFFDFLDSLKKSTAPSPTSSAPTESGSSTAASAPDLTPTRSPSDCGKTPNEAS